MEATAEGQQHPISIYLKIWILLFVLSTLSYMVDIMGFESYLRWGLILTLHVFKSGIHRCDLHAYGLGAACSGLRDTLPTAMPTGVDCSDGN